MNIVNHFLKKLEGEKAVDVVKIILAEMTKENPSILNFSIGVITAAEHAAEAKYNEMNSKKNKESVSDND